MILWNQKQWVGQTSGPLFFHVEFPKNLISGGIGPLDFPIFRT